jgi:hypothetical protein
MKPDISANEGLFKTHKSYSPEEIFAAGVRQLLAVKVERIMKL